MHVIITFTLMCLSLFFKKQTLPMDMAVLGSSILSLARAFEMTNQKSISKAHVSPYKKLFSSYPSYKQIENYLNYVGKQYPNRIKVESIGRSGKNHSIYMVRIGVGIDLAPNNAIFIDGGMHGREWISIMMALYIIHVMGEINPYNDICNLDWIIIPVVNPDGYIYTYKHSKNRMSRKNRNTSECEPEKCKGGDTCGVDIFTNFETLWQSDRSNGCSQWYSGTQPQSEIETINMVKILLNFKSDIKLYLGLHSYGGLILFPYAYGKERHEYASQLEQLGSLAADAMNENQKFQNQSYTVGSYAQTLVPMRGTPLDYVSRELEIRFAYIILMRRTPDDPYGYSPKPKNILELVEECFQGVKTMADYIFDKYPPSKRLLRLVKGFRSRRRSRNSAVIFKGHVVLFCVLGAFLY